VSFRVNPAARRELQEAAAWYDDRQDGLGDQFLDLLTDSFRKIQSEPQRFAPVESIRSRREIRSCPLQRFPYQIIFEVRGDEVVVLAVAHTSRRPNYWIPRRG
jgi:plasmid stabilization system protein ParE